MNLWARLAMALGFDAAVTQTLTVGQARWLAVTALFALPSVVMVGVSAGYGVWLASDVMALAAVVGLGAALYLANLLRMSTAGGGVAAHQELERAQLWFPRLVPMVVLAVLGFFFAQPLLLASQAHQADKPVDELRRALVKMHEDAVVFQARDALRQAQQTLQAATTRREAVRRDVERTTAELQALDHKADADGVDVERRVLRAALEDHQDRLLPLDRAVEDAQRKVARWKDAEQNVLQDDVAPYREHLERSHFMLRRIQLAWSRPAQALGFSLLVILVLLLPWLLQASGARGAVRAYEMARWNATRALVEEAHRNAQQQEAAALSRWATFQGLRTSLYRDPPYNTQQRVPVVHHG